MKGEERIMIFTLLNLCVIFIEITLATEHITGRDESLCTYHGEEYRECGNICEPTCASIHSQTTEDKKKCGTDCLSGCFCRKGFVRDEVSIHSYKPRCIKTSECQKKPCPQQKCVQIDLEDRRRYRLCAKLDPIPCLFFNEPDVDNRTIYFQLLDLDAADAEAIRFVTDKIEQATCTSWSELPRCCILNDPNKERPLHNYVIISDSRWCWFVPQSGEEDCYDVDPSVTPAKWLKGQIFYMLLLSLGIQSESAREDQQVTIHLNIKINGQKQLSANLKNPYQYEYKLYKNPLPSASMKENSSLSKEDNVKKIKTAYFSPGNYAAIEKLFKCYQEKITPYYP